MISEKILERYPEEADRRWINYVAGEVQRIGKEKKAWLSPFLTPYRRQITEEILAGCRDIDYIAYGGYPGAKRVRISAFPAESPHDQLPPLILLHLKGDLFRDEVSEYDLLQAFYSTGLQEDMIGDIIWPDNEEGVKVFIMEDVFNRLTAGLQKAFSKNVEAEKVTEFNPETINSSKSKTIRGTVSSMRLDAIVSLGSGLSRSKAVNSIKGGLVKVNWKTEANPSSRVKEEDFIVLNNGVGFIIESLQGKSRKGRQNLILKKYNNG